MKYISLIVSIRSSVTHSHCFIVHRNHIFRLYQLNESNILLGVLALFVPWGIFGLEDKLGSKNPTRKIVKIHKNFELYQAFMYNFL